MINAHASCQTQLQIGKKFLFPPRPHGVSSGRWHQHHHSVADAVFQTTQGILPTSFVTASSGIWWHTACISGYQWPSTPDSGVRRHQGVSVPQLPGDPEWRERILRAANGKVDKSQHKKRTYCSCEQQGTQHRLWFESSSPNPTKPSMLVSIWRSHTTCNWTRADSPVKWDTHVMSEMSPSPNPKEPPFGKKEGNLQNWCLSACLPHKNWTRSHLRVYRELSTII